MTAASIPLVKQLLDIYGVRAQKEFSQNFLLNNSILSKISNLIPHVSPKTLIVEIGSGPASLSRHLLKRNPAQLLGLEVDRRFDPILAQLAEEHSGRFKPIFGNALDIESILTEHFRTANHDYDSVSIVGNLPFGVASLILQKLLHLFDCTRKDAAPFSRLDVSFVLMFQLQVAQKLSAEIGSDHRGRLSISSQNQFQVDLPMTLNGSDFVPPPKVQAGVVRFVRKPIDDYPSYQSISQLTGILFSRQNRQIYGILKGHRLILPSALMSLGELRPRQLSIEDFQRLARWFHSTN